MGCGRWRGWTLAGAEWGYSPEMLLARDRLSQCWSWRKAETGFSPRRRRACRHGEEGHG